MNTPEYTYKTAHTSTDFSVAADLFREYAASLDFDLGFQNFDAELLQLDRQYGLPEGGLILVLESETGLAIGCVGVRKLEGQIAELKRMYIRDAHRGKGIGKELINKALELSVELGYTRMRLDTIGTMKAAIALYQQAGFYEIEAYRHNPNADVKYMEITLL